MCGVDRRARATPSGDVPVSGSLPAAPLRVLLLYLCPCRTRALPHVPNGPGGVARACACIAVVYWRKPYLFLNFWKSQGKKKKDTRAPGFPAGVGRSPLKTLSARSRRLPTRVPLRILETRVPFSYNETQASVLPYLILWGRGRCGAARIPWVQWTSGRKLKNESYRQIVNGLMLLSLQPQRDSNPVATLRASPQQHVERPFHPRRPARAKTIVMFQNSESPLLFIIDK